MKLIISPAKSLDFDTAPSTKKSSEPDFPKETRELVARLRKLKENDIAKLMDISPKLAKLNYDRFQSFGKQKKKQCVLAFDGDVYAGLDATSLSEADLTFAQKHLRILSGLYGLLKPLDLIEPYRLEMGTKLPRHPREGGDLKIPGQAGNDSLYKFWDDKLTRELGDELVINLASVEYASAVKPKKVINVQFYETPKGGGKPKIIALFAKKARGLMARYIIVNLITKPEDIKGFDYSGYEFSAAMSDKDNYVFIR